ncbi:MAG: PAS domain-containing protein [Proteobacteria bacterium]|nr:PAS domain-containing protein [Pseudomonadota bacterium]
MAEQDRPSDNSNIHQKFSFRIILILAFLSLSAISILLVGGLLTSRMYSQHRENILERYSHFADESSSSVNTFLRDAIAVLETSSKVNFASLVSSNTQGNRVIMAKIISLLPAARDISILNGIGQEIQKMSRLKVISEKDMLSYSQSDLWKEIKKKKIFVGDVKVLETVAEPIVTIAVPILGYRRRTVGGLVGHFNLSFMWELIRSIESSKTGSAFVVDEKQNFLAHSNPNFVLQKRSLPEEISKIIRRNRKKAWSGEVSGEKERVLALSQLEYPAWTVGIELPTREAFAPINKDLIYSIIISFAALIVAFFAGSWLAHRFSAPLIELTSLTSALGKGEFFDNFKIDGPQEIRSLAEAFKKMSQRIRQMLWKLRVEVTTREEAEKDANKSAQQLNSILANTEAVVFVKDLDGKYILVNRRYEELFGIESYQIIGKTDNDCYTAEITALLKKNDQLVLSGNSPITIEEKIPHDAGEKVFLLVKFALRNENYDIWAVCGMATEITERKQLEEQVRRSQKMDAVGHLTGGIAHDFNNILGIIMGNLELIKYNTMEDDKIFSFAESALRGTSRGVTLTKKLLGFSRKHPVKESLVSVNQFIEGIEDLIAKSLTVSISTKTLLNKNIWLVKINPNDLEDVILNLSLNARDAMPDGGKLIIETSNNIIDEDYVLHNPEAEVGEFVMLSVSDTGHGMTAEIRDKVFEPFFSTKEEGKGTGLGLSMVYGFVQRSKGHIRINSVIGEGTSIHIYLPRVHEEIETEKEHSSHTDLPRGYETILVVDDEEALVDIAVSQLESLGYLTVTASTGKEALAVLEENNEIDLMFSDIIMPEGMDGYQLAVAAKKLRPSLKILLTSGFSKQREESVSENKDFIARLTSNLLHKPYNKSELAIRIRKSLVVREHL